MTSDNHVPAEALAAWSEGRLEAVEAATVESHLSSCALCQETLAVFARGVPQRVESGFSRIRPVVAGFSRFSWRWTVPVAAAATAAAIWVAVPNNPVQDEFERSVVAPAVEDRAAAPPASTDTVAPAPQASADAAAATEEAGPLSSRRDAANFGFEDRAEKQAPTPTGRDEDKATTPEPAAAARAAEASAAPDQSRLRAESVTGLQRQAATPEAISPDPLVRWRIIPPARLERSTDGGKTWEPVLLPQPIDLVAVRAPSATGAIVTAAGGRQFRTDDLGKTWNPVQP